MQKLLGRYNISVKYGYQWIAPERTGSRKVAEILSFFGFTNQDRPIFFSNNYTYSHDVNFYEEHENYKLICNARNPYSRVLSIFQNLYQPANPNKTREDFRRYLKYELSIGHSTRIVKNPVLTKKIDYLIRLEHMSEDLQKIPFVLKKLTTTQVEMLSYHPKPIFDWEQFYNQEMKDIVYGYTSHQFEMWGYEK